MTKLNLFGNLLLVIASVSPALADPGDSGSSTALERPVHRCGTHQFAGPVVPSIERLPAGTQRVVYLNRNGGTYTIGRGATNSATNSASSAIWPPGSSGPTTATIPPLASGFDWPKIANCVKQHYQKYNVRFTETEPTSGMYVEAVVGGYGTEIGWGRDQLFGVASADNFCGVTERGIAFNFSETHRGIQRQDDELCATIAHEVGHLLALEHEILAQDVMSYVLVYQSSTKAFVDQQSQCGTGPDNVLSSCACGGNRTNSAARLTQYLGLRSVETTPPQLTVGSPGNGVTLPPTFDVVVTATDETEMADVTVSLDNVEAGSSAEPENNKYKVTVRNAAEGPHTLTIAARDAAGNVTSKDLSITVKKASIGETCSANEECQGNLCAGTVEGGFCTQVCDINAGGCPEDFLCTATGGGGPAICVADPDAGGGCGCASSDGNTGAMAMLALGVGLVLSRRRRR